MHIQRKSMLALVVIALLAAFAMPAFAQNVVTTTVTVTEQQINQSYRVTNSPRRSVSSVVVDLQPGAVVISATWTFPRQEPISTVSTLVPSVSNGRLTWTITSATINGQAASQDIINQVNSAIGSTWRSFFRRYLPAGRLTGITITDTDVVLTLTGR